MKTTDFSFDLPEELIAQHPSGTRGESRLMVLDRRTGAIEHRNVTDLPELLPPDTIMVFNDSRVRKARLYGTLSAGTEREFLLVRELPDDTPGAAPGAGWEAMTRKPRRIGIGTQISFPGGRTARVTAHHEMFVSLFFDRPLDEDYFIAHGHVPLPPYIDRDDESEDEDRYQTVYAREPGSVAAPTAGLHFTPKLLSNLEEKGIGIEWVRLHVGIGTFLPVRVENVDDHVMHEEECELTPDAAARLNEGRRNGRRVLAVGTTSVRTLESAWNRETGELEPFRGATRLFIRPGYEFGAVDALFTNFHTPHSTLLMLVSAFAGRENVICAYETAVSDRYRFFSYGDAMVILDRS